MRVTPSKLDFFHKYSEYFFLAAVILIYTVMLSYYAILRHDAFASGYDLGNMDQTIWNTLHGRFFSFTNGPRTISRFAIHADMFLILLTPLFLIWDNVRTLLIVQPFIIALGAIPVFLLSQKLLKSTLLANIFVLIYLFSPGMQWTNMYDFHSVAFAIPFLLFAFYFAYTKKWKWYFVFIFLAMLTKEEIPLSAAMLGLIIAFVFKNIRIGLATFIIGITWTFIMVRYIIPFYNPQHTYPFYTWYQLVESNITTNKFVNIPAVIVTNFLITPDALSFFITLLKEYSFLPLLGLPWVILALPDLLINTFSDHVQMRSIFFQYDSGIIPGLTVASIYGIYYVSILLTKVKFTTKYSSKLIGALVVVALLIVIRVDYGYSPLPINPSCWCIMYQVSDEDRAFAKVLEQVPQQASVSTSPEIRPHLTHRENAFTIPVATNSADFVALIDQNRIVGNYQSKDLDLINGVKNDPHYELISHIDHFYLFKNKNALY